MRQIINKFIQYMCTVEVLRFILDLSGSTIKVHEDRVQVYAEASGVELSTVLPLLQDLVCLNRQSLDTLKEVGIDTKDYIEDVNIENISFTMLALNKLYKQYGKVLIIEDKKLLIDGKIQNKPVKVLKAFTEAINISVPIFRLNHAWVAISAKALTSEDVAEEEDWKQFNKVYKLCLDKGVTSCMAKHNGVDEAFRIYDHFLGAKIVYTKDYTSRAILVLQRGEWVLLEIYSRDEQSAISLNRHLIGKGIKRVNCVLPIPLKDSILTICSKKHSTIVGWVDIDYEYIYEEKGVYMLGSDYDRQNKHTIGMLRTEQMSHFIG